MLKLFFFLSITLLLAGFSYPQESGETKIAETVTYISGSDSVKGYFALPEGEGKFPAVIVIHEWWGLTEWIKEQADKLAENGYAALAVDLYRGKVTDDPGEAHELMRGVPEDRVVRDLKAAFSYLKDHQMVDDGRIGSIGWCMGGGYSLQAAINIPEISACVIAYGRLVTDQSVIEKIECPVLGIFGEADRGISVADVKAFEHALNEAEIENKIIIYPETGHAFMNPGNEKGYNEKAAAEAWNEIYNFLNDNLK